MKTKVILFTLVLLIVSTATALEPLKVAFYKSGGTANVQIIINDYSNGSASPKFTSTPKSLTPNGSGIIIVYLSDAGLGTIDASDVNPYYVVDVFVNSNLYAQYRLDQLIKDQYLGNILDANGDLTTSNSNSSIGSDDKRWKELFVDGNTVHIGPALGMVNGDELAFSYDDATNTATMTVAGETALTSVDDNITIPKQAIINGLTIGRGSGNISTNSAIGTTALFSNTIGFNNTASGNSSLSSNTEGNNNTANGVYAMQNNITGSNNTVNGVYALFSNTTGNSNSANGYGALYSNSTGSNNTANGINALYSNTEGVNNTANGIGALQNNTEGDFNTANGSSALFNNNTGSNNTANGAFALQNNTSGSNNSANGYGALYSNSTGSNNTANGINALYSNTSGVNNTANGIGALQNNTLGHFNSANGSSALFSNITGSNNTALGTNSGYKLTSGSNNIFIGNNAGNNLLQSTAAINSVAIGANTYTTADNQVVLGDANITETQLNGRLQNDVTTATHAQLINAKTSVISYTEGTDVSTGELPPAIDGTFLYIHCTVAIADFLGSGVAINEVVSCVRIAGVWRRVK